jgi:hypothetical protein
MAVFHEPLHTKISSAVIAAMAFSVSKAFRSEDYDE